MCKGQVVWKLWLNRLDRQDCCVYHTHSEGESAFAAATTSVFSAARGAKTYAHAVLISHFTLKTLPTLHPRHTYKQGTIGLLYMDCLCEHGLFVCYDMLATNSVLTARSCLQAKAKSMESVRNCCHDDAESTRQKQAKSYRPDLKWQQE